MSGIHASRSLAENARAVAAAERVDWAVARSGVPACVTDRTGAIVSANDAYRRLLGYEFGDAAPTPGDVIIGADGSGPAESDRESVPRASLRLRLRRTDGTLVPTQVLSIYDVAPERDLTLFIPDGSSPVADLGRLLLAARGVRVGRDPEARLRPIFEGSSHAMLLADDDRRYTDCNSAASALLGLSRAEIMGRRIDDLTPEADRDQMAAHWSDLLARGSLTGTFAIASAGNGALSVQLAATANVLPGQHLAVLIPVDSELHEPTPGPARELEETAPTLTAREREVLTLIAIGASSESAASALGVGAETIRTHVANAMAKLGAHTRAQAIALALRDGSIDP
jgi:PAS domain-containing protein/DNA-binding CsgD family transcriptional regulator